MSVRRFVDDISSSLSILLEEDNGGGDREIVGTEIFRPSLALTGYFDRFSDKQIQVIGLTEIEYIKRMSASARRDVFTRICSYEKLPCFIVSRNLETPGELYVAAKEKGIPILTSPRKTSEVISIVSDYLRDKFAPKKKYHGELVVVYGIGVLIIGKAAVGKSECALDLIMRGHYLVADDIAILKRKTDEVIIGYPHPTLSGLLGIQGIGIFNVPNLFGVRSLKSSTRLDLVIKIEEIDRNKEYDLTGLDRVSINVMGIDVPFLLIPVVPGKSLATIIEIAAMNELHKREGYNEVESLDVALKKTMGE